MIDDKKVTFFSKTMVTCLVCDTGFYKEELFSGGGRLMAGDLTDDLRRLYEPSKKYGELYPLIYYIIVCPNCFFASFPGDFLHADVIRFKNKLDADMQRRKESVALIFDNLSFSNPRRLIEGAASYIISIKRFRLPSNREFPRCVQPGY